MSRELVLDVEGVAVERAAADLACVPIFRDERPLRGGAGRADWRLCGALSALLVAGRLAGEPGEVALVATFGGLRAPWLLVLGAGDRSGFDARRLEALAGEAVRRAIALRVSTLAFPFPHDAGGAVAQERRVAALLAGAAAAIAEAEPPCRLRLRVVAAPEEATRIAALLRRIRVPRLAESVALRLPLGSAAPRPPAPAPAPSAGSPRGPAPIK